MVSVKLNAIPDKDRFLPRYLCKQLISVLASILPKDCTQESSSLSPKANNFIASYKKADGFTPLTYSIFWRDNPIKLLEQATNIDQLDKYNHNALTIALANEDFALANKLIQLTANIYLEHKLVLEISLSSIIQRDPEAITKILANTPEADRNWIKEYLDYLHAHLSGTPSSKHAKFRDMFDPNIRHFGQVLDTMAYFNGIPSYYGFIGPSLSMLTRHLNKYAQELASSDRANLVIPISNAFAYSQATCKFIGNTPSNDAAQNIAHKIMNNITTKSQDLVIMLGGWACNSVAIGIINQTLMISALGVGGDLEAGTKIYKISNPGALTPQAIDIFMRGFSNAASPTVILALISEIVDPEPIFTIKQDLIPIDNCIFVNPRAIIQAAMLILACIQKNNEINSQNLAALSAEISNLYQEYLKSLHQEYSSELITVMRNRESLHNQRLECCSLALDYINQHYQQIDALKRCVDLKNVLEFVGLKSYYEANIDPKAKDAIQKFTINEQEITAVRVIEQEYAILGKKQ